MKKTNLMTVTALAASFAVAVPSFASTLEATSGNKAPGKEITTDFKAEVKAYEAEKQALLSTLFETQMYAELESEQAVEDGLNKASAQLEALVDDGVTAERAVETPAVKIIEIKYGNALLPKTVYAPVSDSDISVETLKEKLDLRGVKDGDIEDVSIRYAHLMVDQNELTATLNDAREELAEGDMDDVREELVDAQETMIRDFATTVDADVEARDHIELTRFLVQSGEYEGAREALEDAEKALFALQIDTDFEAKGSVAAKNIKQSVKELSDLIDRKDPTLVGQIDSKLEEWLDDLS